MKIAINSLWVGGYFSNCEICIFPISNFTISNIKAGKKLETIRKIEEGYFQDRSFYFFYWYFECVLMRSVLQSRVGFTWVYDTKNYYLC
jgi:hypothetical protein